ncbi:MAG TPA: hypothetical protein VMI92_04995 [Steroidobacteraceae bacterium]|nr:hypothetical protein [Steroidobacteraceae bacterium]
MMRNFWTLMGVALGVLALLHGVRWMGAAGPASANAHLAFDGVWQIEAPLLELKTDAGGRPPLNPAAAAVYDQRRAARQGGDVSWDPASKCKPLGEPRALMQDEPFELFTSDLRTGFLFQWNRLARFVVMADRHGPQLGPFYFGESIGRWDHDTLVVDVINVKANALLDPAGLPHSEDMHLVERFSLEGGKLVARLHVEDPATYTAPWDATLTFVRKPGVRIREDVCPERLQLTSDFYLLQNALK